jgi:uncharacterized repeat protein (TIGR03803 family)
MRKTASSFGLRSILTIFAASLLTAVIPATAQKASVLYSFHTSGKDGYAPYAGLVFDGVGNLYGATTTGGVYNGGTVFELSPNQNGGWTRKILHQFTLYGSGGYAPYASLVLDAAGNLYGTTAYGGSVDLGTVFELTPAQGGSWKEKVLYSFGRFNSDGVIPFSGVTFDAAGNLYGTTSRGGAGCFGSGCGAVFELTPTAGGGWKEKILHRFQVKGVDGMSPIGGVILDASGNLYGTTSVGGDPQCAGDGGGLPGCGAVFELSPNADGSWTETLLYAFTINFWDGTYPYSGLVFDKSGNLYGTTFEGGRGGEGTVFELMPQKDGSWDEKIVHAFGEQPGDGSTPYAGVTVDAAGNLYGTTTSYGGYGTGMVFELTPMSGGSWSETLLHRFNGSDGSEPFGGVVLDAGGNLYGTTGSGGPNGGGTVFKIAP